MSINIIPQDLRQEEMLLQIEETLATLKKMSDQVFSRIESRIDRYQKELEDIDKRADVVRDKVEQLKSSKNKAIKIFSSPKYPAADDDDELYVALCPFMFSNILLSPFTPSNIPLCPSTPSNILLSPFTPSNIPLCPSTSSNIPLCPFISSNERTMKRFQVKSTHIPFDDEVLKEKLQFYQVPKLRPSFRSVDPSEGPLGSIPWRRISSISSLVMFNSSENPYCRRSQGSSLMESKMKKKIEGVEERDAFVPTSQTVSAEKEPVRDLFSYNPDLEAAPKIIDFLPAALPDLPGIADDILFDDEAAFAEFSPQSNRGEPARIEPVLNRGEPARIEPVLNRGEPARIEPVLNRGEPARIEPVLVKQTEVSVPKSDASSPRVDRDGITMTPSVVPVIVPAVVGKPVSPSSGPPPPPPPLPPLSPPLPPPSTPQDEVKTSSAPAADGGRASLLDAIRKAGGKPKKVSGGTSKELKIERKMEKKKEVVSTDLMTDLANKLKARRTGISGANEGKPASAMDRVASMIPPPPKPSAMMDEQEDEDSDWE